MRIHQITDLHIPDGEMTNGQTKSNVLKLLSFVREDNSDLLVISGDLTMTDGSVQANEWLNSVLPEAPQTIIMPGNHDKPSVLWEVFGPKKCINHDFYFALDIDAYKLLFVDTSSYSLPDDQIEFIKREAANQASLLFIHHPPDIINPVGFMGINHALANAEQVSKVIKESKIKHVLCGHYNNAIDKRCDGFYLHLTPSPAFQIDLDSEEFHLQPFEPGVRIIDIEQSSVTSHIVYV